VLELSPGNRYGLRRHKPGDVVLAVDGYTPGQELVRKQLINRFWSPFQFVSLIDDCAHLGLQASHSHLVGERPERAFEVTTFTLALDFGCCEVANYRVPVRILPIEAPQPIVHLAGVAWNKYGRLAEIIASDS